MKEPPGSDFKKRNTLKRTIWKTCAANWQGFVLSESFFCFLMVHLVGLLKKKNYKSNFERTK